VECLAAVIPPFSLGIQLLEAFFLELGMTPPAAAAARKS